MSTLRSRPAAALLSCCALLILSAGATAHAAPAARNLHAGSASQDGDHHDGDHHDGDHQDDGTPAPPPPFNGEGTCTDILSGAGNSAVPVAFLPVVNGQLTFEEDLGNPDTLSAGTSCPGDDYTLSAYATSTAYGAGAAPVGSQTLHGDGTTGKLQFTVPLSDRTLTSVCVVATNGQANTTLPVPAVESTTVERAPQLGDCLTVADGTHPGGSFH